MAGKKKSKGSKLSRMSEEERARYLQHRAELEIEAKRRKQQLIAIFTKNKLKREEAFSRLNTAKINEQWRFILRQIKCKELHQGVEYLWKNFDRLMKAKDSIISRLYNELEISDIDHRKLQEAHIETMDSIMGKHMLRLKYLHNVYMDELDHIKSSDVIELNRLKAVMEQNRKEIYFVNSRKDTVLQNKLSLTRTRNSVYLHNVLYLEEDLTSDLIQQTNTAMADLWEQLNEMIDEYKNTTQNKRKQYEYLKEQDDAHQSDVAQYPEIHSQLQSTIDLLKHDTETLLQKRGERIAKLKMKANEMKQKIEHLRQAFAVAQIEDSSQLKKLSVISNRALKDLQKAAEKGSMLLQFINMCSNLEPLLLNLRKYFVQDSESTEPHNNYVSKPFDKLENFWEQYNQIKAENIWSKKECRELSSENKRLRHTLRTYLIRVSGVPAPRPLTSISI